MKFFVFVARVDASKTFKNVSACVTTSASTKLVMCDVLAFPLFNTLNLRAAQKSKRLGQVQPAKLADFRPLKLADWIFHQAHDRKRSEYEVVVYNV